MMNPPPTQDRLTKAMVPSQLFVWLSPAFPISSFAYSNGLEAAASRGWVHDRQTLEAWLEDLITCGGLRNDLILLSLTHRAADDPAAREIAELSDALQPSAERSFEMTTQAAGFRAGYLAGWSLPSSSRLWQDDDVRLTLPVAIGLAARDHRIDLATTLEAYAMTYLSNLCSAAMRLGVIGQFDAQHVLASLLSAVRMNCDDALASTADDLGSATFGADLASMHHETQTVRVFRS